MKTALIILGVAATIAAAGCDNKDKGTTGTTGTKATASAQAAAGGDPKQEFSTRCASCHGADGKGTGPAAAALNPKPRNFGDKDWQKATTDDQIKKTITQGGAAVGKSAIMPAQPDLDSQPVVLDGLVKVIRDFGK